MEEGTQRAGEYSTKGGIYFNTYAMNGGRGQDTNKKKRPTAVVYFTMHLFSLLLNGQGATDFHAKTPEKNRENWARRPLMFLGAGMTARL